jgi:hypothetical protein
VSGALHSLSAPARSSRTPRDRLACFGVRAVFVCGGLLGAGCAHGASEAPRARTPSAPASPTTEPLESPSRPGASVTPSTSDVPRAALELDIDTQLVRELGWISPPEQREGTDSLPVEDELASLAAWVAPVWDQLERIRLRVVPRASEVELHLLCTFTDPDAADGAARMLHGLAALWASRVERAGDGGMLAAQALFAVRVGVDHKLASAKIALPPADAARVLRWLTRD